MRTLTKVALSVMGIVAIVSGVGILTGAHATVSHGALIIDTLYSSSIIDGHGVAVSIVPSGLSCGVDDMDGAWCEVADYS